jgi:hypothetical protein
VRAIALTAAVVMTIAPGAWAITLRDVRDVSPGTLKLSLPDAGRPQPQVSAAEAPIQPRTAVDHRFTQDGLTGSAGYLCGIGGIGPDTDATRGGPSSAFAHYGTFLGATVGYPLP